MPNIEKVVDLYLRVLGLTSLVAGAIPGWIAVFFLDEEMAAGTWSARFYLSLFVLMPAALAVSTRLSVQRGAQNVYADLTTGITVAVVLGAVGAFLGSLLFAVLALYIPAVFGRMDWAAIQRALFARVGWATVGALAGVTAISGMPIAIWAHRQCKGDAQVPL